MVLPIEDLRDLVDAHDLLFSDIPDERTGIRGNTDWDCLYEIRTEGLNNQITRRTSPVVSSAIANRYDACAWASSSISETRNTDNGNRTGLAISDGQCGSVATHSIDSSSSPS